MPSYLSDVPGGVPSAGQPWLSGAEAGLLGLSAAGSLGAMVESRRRRKKLGALRQSMLNEIDSGASDARGAVGREAQIASGAADQSAINRGFFNSTVASDAQSGIRLDAGARMGDISARAGRERAQVLYDTFDQGGGPDLSGIGRIGGLVLASRLGNQTDSRNLLNASQVSQSAGRVPAMMQTGGDPATSSGMYDSVYEGGGPDLEMSGDPLIDRQIASATRRRKWALS